MPASFLHPDSRNGREPVARYGPFVMNTRDEILQAMRDDQEGRMGTIDFCAAPLAQESFAAMRRFIGLELT